MAGRLTAQKVKNLTSPGRYGDGDGLWLQVRDAKRRSWLFRYSSAGKARQMGLGALPDVSLAEARDRAAQARRVIRDGQDPIDQRRGQRRVRAAQTHSPTFRLACQKYIAAHEAGWRSPVHRAQWRNTLEANALPLIGDLPVNAIDTAAVTRVLEPIWHRKPETAARLRARIEAVLDYATAMRWRSEENPARWRGHLSNVFESRRRLARALHDTAIVKHHDALPWREIGNFLDTLRQQNGVAARALELTILTAARTGETLGATWSEIDIGSAIWVIPAHRTKAGRQHRIPLSDAAMAVLGIVALLGDDPDSPVFPGGVAGRPLAGTAMRKVLIRMKRNDMTVHGFRSTFRDWCAEATNYPREVAEQALAHAVSDRVEAAYRRGDLLQKRRTLMEAWADFCTTSTVEPVRPELPSAGSEPLPTKNRTPSAMDGSAQVAPGLLSGPPSGGS
jgi:integrase